MSFQITAQFRHFRSTLPGGRALLAAWLLLGLLGCAGSEGENAGNTGTSRLIAADATGTIFALDPTTGAMTELGDTGVAGIRSMAYSASAGTVYAATSDGVVYTVVPETGGITQLTFDDQTGGMFGLHTGMAAHPTTGHLYVVRESECSDMFSFDPATLVAVGALNAGMPACYSLNDGGFPIAFDGADNLYLIKNYNDANELHLVDLPGDNSTSLGTFTFSGFPTPGSEGHVNGLAVRPQDGKAYVTTTAGEFGVLSWSTPLTVTYVATFPDVLDGLAAVGGGRPPYPAGGALALVPDFGTFAIFYADLSWQDYPVAEDTVLYWGVNLSGIDPADPATYTGSLSGVGASPFRFDMASNGVPGGSAVSFRIAHKVGGAIVAVSDEAFTVVIDPPR